MRILLTGTGGQVGGELQQLLPSHAETIGLDRAGLDLADGDAIRRRVRDIRPGIIVNAAAYTAVDQAESEPGAAHAINARAPAILAEEAKRAGALLVHYSTDYVFDGLKAGPYSEEDAPSPLNAYGRTKLEGERAIQDSGCRHLILRTSWVYGLRGRNFLLTMLKLANERAQLRVVNDQHGAPTWCRTIAQTTVALLETPDAAGLYHLTCSGSASWFDFALAILEGTSALRERQPEVIPIATSEFKTAARRPANSRLNTARIVRALGNALPDWRTALDGCLAELRTSP